MCVCFKHLITFSDCKGEECENIRTLLIIALENEIRLRGQENQGMEEEKWH